MRTLPGVALLAFQLMLPEGLAANPASKAASSTASEQTAAQLLEFLGGGKDDGHNWRLNRHWVGTMKIVIGKDARTAGEKDEPVRFNAFAGRSKPGTRKEDYPALMAAGKHGACYWTRYRRELPTLADLRNGEKLPGIIKSFGEPGWPDAWGGFEGETHWSGSWLWFCRTEDGRIRVLSVAVSTLAPKGKPEKMDRIEVREGFFRPSDPADPEDVRNFPPEEVREAKRLAEIDAEDDKYPEPLRSYLKAEHAPGDSDLKIRFAAVRRFRDKPDGLLLKQMAAWLDESESTGVLSIEIPGMLETLFHDFIFEKNIGGWNAKKRQQAQALLLDALPEANSRESLRTTVELALRETGVQSLKLDTSDLEVDLSSRYAKNGRPAGTESAFTLKTATVRRAGEILRDEILSRWEKGK